MTDKQPNWQKEYVLTTEEFEEWVVESKNRAAKMLQDEDIPPMSFPSVLISFSVDIDDDKQEVIYTSRSHHIPAEIDLTTALTAAGEVAAETQTLVVGVMVISEAAAHDNDGGNKEHVLAGSASTVDRTRTAAWALFVDTDDGGFMRPNGEEMMALPTSGDSHSEGTNSLLDHFWIAYAEGFLKTELGQSLQEMFGKGEKAPTSPFTVL